ncbi:carbohydrate ABC transporter permease [Microbacterium azadirachtae]|jgi:multiple sugar transport system permease protein/N-acetylglucosamine transport system permease protein|uniref:carbohydrate ABC transporter permease n=1 Tax=Microbacterium azadirachtae TaxID=582680 RepID=UPI003F753A82
MTSATRVLTTAGSRRGRAPRSAAGKVGVAGGIGRALVWLLVAFNIFLIAWMVVSSLRSTADYLRQPLGLPVPPHLENYANAWTIGDFGVAFLNSASVTLISAFLAVAIAAPAAYALSRSTRWIAPKITAAFALGLGVPGQVLLIPIYIGLAQVQQNTGIPLIDSQLGLTIVLVGLNLPFTVFLLTGFFASLPGEIEEAAALDGASGLRTFVTIMLPLARPGLTTAMTLAAIGSWNETLFSLVLLTDKSTRTLPIALIQIMNSAAFNGADWGSIFAGMTLMVLPLLIVYTWLGRRIVAGMTVGAGK